VSEKSRERPVNVPADPIPRRATRCQMARWRLARKIAVANEAIGCIVPMRDAKMEILVQS
jgi:hypothetical protein